MVTFLCERPCLTAAARTTHSDARAPRATRALPPVAPRAPRPRSARSGGRREGSRRGRRPGPDGRGAREEDVEEGRPPRCAQTALLDCGGENHPRRASRAHPPSPPARRALAPRGAAAVEKARDEDDDWRPDGRRAREEDQVSAGAGRVGDRRSYLFPRNTHTSGSGPGPRARACEHELVGARRHLALNTQTTCQHVFRRLFALEASGETIRTTVWAQGIGNWRKYRGSGAAGCRWRGESTSTPPTKWVGLGLLGHDGVATRGAEG